MSVRPRNFVNGAVERRLLFACMYAAFLIAALLSIFAPWRLSGLARSPLKRLRIFQQARAQTNKAIGFVYMG